VPNPLPEPPVIEIRNILGTRVMYRIIGREDLVGYDFTQLSTSYSNANFAGMDLTNAVFDRCQMEGASFEGAILKGASFNRAYCYNVNFKLAKAQGARFTYATMDYCNVSRGNFRNADFTSASL